MKIKELRRLTGMSQSEFAAYFGLSVRSVQPPPYLVGLLKRILDNEYFNSARNKVESSQLEDGSI